MNKNQASQLLGEYVSAWTATKGEYVGKLVEVIAFKGKPWRGLVEVETIIGLPDFTRYEKKPFKKGDIIEVGGVNIKEYNDEIPDYEENWYKLLKHQRHFLENYGVRERNQYMKWYKTMEIINKKLLGE